MEKQLSDYSIQTKTSWLVRFINLAGDFVFLLPVVLVPLVFSAANTHTIVIKETIVQISTVLLLVFLPFVWLMDRPSRERSRPFPFPALLLIALSLLLLYLYYSAYSVASGHPRSVRELYRWLAYITLAVGSIYYAANTRRFSLYLSISVIVSVAISGYAISQRLGYDFFPWDDFKFGEEGIGRASASLGNPDYLAGYLVALLPLTLIWTIARRGLSRLILGGTVILQVAALFFSYSRGGWVAAFTTLILLFASLTYINWVRDPVLFRPVISRKGAIAVLSTLLFFCCLSIFSMWNDITATAFRFARIGDDTSILTRPYFWAGALRIWLDRPLFGFGIGTFLLHFPDYRDTSLSIYLPFKQFNVSHAHNEYLEILSETGIAGLVLYALVFLVITRIVWKAMLAHREKVNLTLIGLWTGMTGLFIHNLFTVTLRNTPSAFLLWSFAGVMVGRSLALSGHLSNNKVWFHRILNLGLLIVAPFLFVYAVRTYTGDYLIKSGLRIIAELDEKQAISYNREISERALVALYKGRLLVPDNHESNYYTGLVYFKIFDYPQAIEAYQKQVDLKQSFTSNRMNIGVCYAKQADLIGSIDYFPHQVRPFPLLANQCLKESVEWFENSHQDDPTSPEHLHYMGISLFNLGDFGRAEQAFADAIEKARARPFEIPAKLRDIYYYLGLARFNLQKWEISKQAFEEALRLSNTLPFENRIKQQTIYRHLLSIQNQRQQGQKEERQKPE